MQQPKEALRDAQDAILVACQSLLCTWFGSHRCELLPKTRVLEAPKCFIVRKARKNIGNYKEL